MSHTIEFVPVDLIDPHPHNPRRDLGDLTELADSIRVQGIRQNLLLVPQPGPEVGTDRTRYTAVIGHRRLAAARASGLAEVPAVIDPSLTEAGQIELMLLENVQRQDLSPVEEAEGYQQLLDLGVKPKDIAKMTGRSGSTIHARLQLLKLPEDAREKVHADQATLEDAAELLKLEDAPAELERVTKALGTANFDYELKSARSRIARERRLAPLFAEAERLGAVRGEWDWQRQDRVGCGWTVEEIAALAPLPEGAIYQLADYSDYVYLYAPKSAEEIALREKGAQAAEAERVDWAARRKAEEEAAAQAKAEGEQAWELRGEFVVAFCSRKRILAKESLAIVAAVAPLVLKDGLYVDAQDWADWLWLAEGGWSSGSDLLAAFDQQCPSLDRSLMLLAGLHLSTRTARWSHAHSDTSLVTLYGLLEQLGYPVSDAERARITPPADEAEDGDR